MQPKQNHKEKEIINYCADGAGELWLLQISRLWVWALWGLGAGWACGCANPSKRTQDTAEPLFSLGPFWSVHFSNMSKWVNKKVTLGGGLALSRCCPRWLSVPRPPLAECAEPTSVVLREKLLSICVGLVKKLSQSWILFIWMSVFQGMT